MLCWCFFFPIDVSLFREKESKFGQSSYLFYNLLFLLGNICSCSLFLWFRETHQYISKTFLKHSGYFCLFYNRTIAFPQQMTEISGLLNMRGEFWVNYSGNSFHTSQALADNKEGFPETAWTRSEVFQIFSVSEDTKQS